VLYFERKTRGNNMRNVTKRASGEDTTIVTIRMPISTLRKIDYYAQIARKSRNAFILQAVEEKIERMRQELSQNHMEEWE